MNAKIQTEGERLHGESYNSGLGFVWPLDEGGDSQREWFCRRMAMECGGHDKKLGY